MLNKDYTTKLLNLEDVKITNAKSEIESIHVYMELPRKEHLCPACGATTSLVHDYREQVVKDVPLGRATYLHLRKRRYRCPECGKHFAENNVFLPRYHRMTSRLVASIIDAFHKVTSATEIAAQYNVSVSTALRCFDSFLMLQAEGYDFCPFLLRGFLPLGHIERSFHSTGPLKLFMTIIARDPYFQRSFCWYIKSFTNFSLTSLP